MPQPSVDNQGILDPSPIDTPTKYRRFKLFLYAILLTVTAAIPFVIDFVGLVFRFIGDKLSQFAELVGIITGFERFSASADWLVKEPQRIAKQKRSEERRLQILREMHPEADGGWDKPVPEIKHYEITGMREVAPETTDGESK